ncbi:sperm-associated antigen 16 protein [Fundulus heteroclitus]|uniref:sperm-associated antigen 16 protein n=1 Tax=Fundulus heteroclitus TaxID=8078 RepID=UPI00165B1448|nr:sperm-associated antigen 16 protein [Fundulus heteroclitus]
MSARRDGEEEKDGEASSSSSSAPSRRNPEVPMIQNIPETVEDFLRNFLGRLGLTRTLSSFQVERYHSAETCRFIPDALTHGQMLQEELDAVRRDTELLGKEVLEAEQSLVRMRRERDFHRLQHRRVSAQKESLAEDRKQLQEHLENCEAALKQLEEKHRAALRTKALLGLQRERGQHLPEPKLHQEKPNEKPAKRRLCRSPKTPKDAQGPPQEKTSFQLSCSIRAHQQPVSCIALHPRNPLLASASHDRTWRLWHLPRSGEKVGQVLLRGEGHSDWLSGCTFHPDGSNLATTSGDTTVRLWDLSRGRCVSTLRGHSQPTWGCWFHSCGHLLASCSADRTAKLWDVASGRCGLTLRRHAASVNSVAFLPASHLLLTCSADKTLVLWDARLGVAAATFRGHRHPCNHAAFSPAPHAVASCDSRGVVHLWDARKPASPTAAAEAGPPAANQLAFSQSGKLLAVAGGDGSVRLVAVDSCGVSSLTGHEGSVQSVTFDHEGRALVSAGSDGLIGVWF